MGASDYKYPAGTVTMDSVSAGTTSFETVEIPFVVGTAAGSPSRGVKDFYEHVIPSFAGISGPPKKYHVDNREVTNAKWDEVVEWSENNGYDLVKAPTGTDPDMPRTRVSILDAIKWCNARSEMEGFTPVYYVDQEEAMEDMNRDGAYTNGPDYVYPRTEEEQQNFDWEKADLNQNLAWDPGEPFIDKNSNGKFDPKEFVDFNQNGKRDTGLTQPYRVGDLTAYVTLNAPWWQDVDTYSQQPWSLHHHEMPKANGYRLPGQGWSDGPEGGSNGAEFYYLAMGGHGENTSVAYKEEWPWGAKAPAGKTDLAKYVVTTIGGNVQSVPLPVGARKPTVEGLYDMIGNVAEWTAEMGILKDTTGPDGGFAGTLSYILEPVGGSCRGLPDGSDTFGWAMNGGFGIPEITPSSVMVAGEHADRNGEPWVGFRSMRIEF